MKLPPGFIHFNGFSHHKPWFFLLGYPFLEPPRGDSELRRLASFFRCGHRVCVTFAGSPRPVENFGDQKPMTDPWCCYIWYPLW